MNDDTNRNNRRSEDREQLAGKARIRVLEAPSADLRNASFDADVYDTSASGLRVECDEMLDGCTLLMHVSLEGLNDTLPIRGEVLWASFEEDGSFQMGIEFRDNDTPVIVKWHNMLKAASAK